MACASPAYLSGTHWFLFVAVISFIATLIWIFIYFLSVREALKLPINWILTVRSETCHTSGLYLYCTIYQATLCHNHGHCQAVVGHKTCVQEHFGSLDLYVCSTLKHG